MSGTNIGRRQFFQAAAAAGGLALAGSWAKENAPSQTIRVAVMGVHGRGRRLAGMFASRPGVEVAYLCDVDRRAFARAMEQVLPHQSREPRTVGDFREALDDTSVDALVVAAPNHWHAPATILACSAGKHVYVEKPGSHNPREAELIVDAARKHNRHVQMGNQRRSNPAVREAMELLHDGAIGRVYLAQVHYNRDRSSIGHGRSAPVPDWLDYDLWQGPAPRRPYRDNLIHYNWHWFWHWGNGELGNNGVHRVDIARWGLGVDYPRHVTSMGSRYHWDDDQQTPDTQTTLWQYDNCQITWVGLSCHPYGPPRRDNREVTFHGTEGTVATHPTGYRVYDEANHEIGRAEHDDRQGERHVDNFLAGVREEQPLNSEIGNAQKSTILCHLGNIAQREGRVLNCDPDNARILDDPRAMALWEREYEDGWQPLV